MRAESPLGSPNKVYSILYLGVYIGNYHVYVDVLHNVRSQTD